jgi:hypothetical protein
MIKRRPTVPWLNIMAMVAILFVAILTTMAEAHPGEPVQSQDRVLNKQPLYKLRLKRQTNEDDLPVANLANSEPESGSGETESEPEEKGKKGGVSLGKILGSLFLACCILYCFGIAWKIYKICKGTYVEEEPVFLKYK